MTETRKELINILSDYMDKTLSEGCLVKFMGEPVSFITKDKDEDWDDIYILNVWNRCEIWICPPILWHYDITAVLKYIEKEWLKNYDVEIEIVIDWDDINILWETWYFNNENWTWCTDYFDYTIQNKPLYLYTKQEEESLLELLNTLWKQATV